VLGRGGKRLTAGVVAGLNNTFEARCVRARLDILLEAVYRHLECLLKKSARASNCCKERWIC